MENKKSNVIININGGITQIIPGATYFTTIEYVTSNEISWNEISWNDLVLEDGITKWCYIEDLLLKEEE